MENRTEPIQITGKINQIYEKITRSNGVITQKFWLKNNTGSTIIEAFKNSFLLDDLAIGDEVTLLINKRKVESQGKTYNNVYLYSVVHSPSKAKKEGLPTKNTDLVALLDGKTEQTRKNIEKFNNQLMIAMKSKIDKYVLYAAMLIARNKLKLEVKDFINLHQQIINKYKSQDLFFTRYLINVDTTVQMYVEEYELLKQKV